MTNRELNSVRHQRAQRGTAAVELGILLVPLTMLVFGTAEYGRATHNYNKVVKSTRDAVRYLTQFAPGDATAIAAAKNLVVFGNVAGTGTALVSGLAVGNVSVCDSSNCAADHALQPTGSGTVNLVKVTVSGVIFTSLVPAMVANMTFGPISATMGQVL